MRHTFGDRSSPGQVGRLPAVACPVRRLAARPVPCQRGRVFRQAPLSASRAFARPPPGPAAPPFSVRSHAWLLALGLGACTASPRAPPVCEQVVTGRFVDVTSPVLPPNWPADDIAAPQSDQFSIGHFTDLDQDGRDELVFSIPRNQQLAIYEQDAAGAWQPAVRALPSGVGLIGLFDADGDTRVDFVSGPSLLFGPFGGGVSDRPADVVGMPPRDADQALLDDFDDDGWLDFAVSWDGRCEENSLYLALRTGLRTWTARSLGVRTRLSAGNGTMFSGRPGGGRRLFGALGTCDFRDEIRELGVRDADGWPLLPAIDPLPAELQMAQPMRPATRPGFYGMLAPMGAGIADLDEDGLFELAVTGNPRLWIFQGRAELPLGSWREPTVATLAKSDNGREMIPWAISMLDFNRDGHRDYLMTRGRDAIPHELIGPQFVTLHAGDGRGGACDVTARSGLDRRGEWRALTIGDPDRDGDPDLVVGGHGVAPRVYRNDLGGGHGLSLRLRGTTSNHLGIGAIVEVVAKPGDRPRRYHVPELFGPFVVQEPLVFATLGESERAHEVRVDWPSGTRQVVSGLEAGRLHELTEPRTLEVWPPTRHLFAAGEQRAVLRILPRREDGSLDAEATVSVRRVAGTGSVAGAPERVGEAWHVGIVPGDEAGSGVFEVLVRDVPHPIRPRLWWDAAP